MTTADEIRHSLTASAARINGQKDLTPHAKRVMLARAYVEARDGIDALREKETKDIQRERQQLERRLFGTTGFNPDPQLLIAKRDADDRAAKYETPAEARRALQRAERDGDSLLAKAIASRAADWSGDPQWGALVREYVAERPAEAETLKAMQELPDTDDAVFRLQQAMRYGIATPDGLGEAHRHSVDMLARQPLDGDAAA
ncbi:hypothetical protein PUR59_30500 [Streptomyces sp. SP18ES09]|uniref:hypothetical protein n=1 Tax=Streptomyces sp. SP18ES09 TaxID=3002532 RepID=UPI002E76E87C|nr:hypothetical protein [Streptomyces sp. SP18ES09]MEE1819332.1 hypothetical protein [Streptomyces sp. SP18ES09]